MDSELAVDFLVTERQEEEESRILGVRMLNSFYKCTLVQCTCVGENGIKKSSLLYKS